MKHEFATATHAVERYLIGDMPADERDAFEDHFFSCEICAEDLRVTARFIENARSVFEKQALEPPRLSFAEWLRSKWLSPVLVAVSAAACAVVVFQNTVTIPALNAPRALPALTLDLTSRSAVPRLNPGDPLHFYVATTQAAGAPDVRAELSTEAGRVLRSGDVAAPPAQQPVDVYFPGAVSPGRYIITIRSLRNGQTGEQLARQTFEVATGQEHTN